MNTGQYLPSHFARGAVRIWLPCTKALQSGTVGLQFTVTGNSREQTNNQAVDTKYSKMYRKVLTGLIQIPK